MCTGPQFLNVRVFSMNRRFVLFASCAFLSLNVIIWVFLLEFLNFWISGALDLLIPISALSLAVEFICLFTFVFIFTAIPLAVPFLGESLDAINDREEQIKMIKGVNYYIFPPSTIRHFLRLLIFLLEFIPWPIF